MEFVVRGKAVAGSTTTFRVTPQSVLPEDGGAPGASSVLFHVVTQEDAAAAGPSVWSDQLYGTYPVSCASGPCDGRFTFRAFLTDPSDGARRVTWRATAETRNPAGVAVRARFGAHDRCGRAGRHCGRHHDVGDRRLRPRHGLPRPPAIGARRCGSALRSARRLGIWPPGRLLRVTGTASDGEQPAPFRMKFQTPTDRAYEMPVNGTTLYDPFSACVAGAPCVGDYQVIFEWTGGPFDREAVIEADLSAWLPRPEDAPADADLDLSVTASEPDRPGPVVGASLSGVFEIDRDTSQGAVIDAVLDQQAMPQGTVTEGVARATLRTRLVDMDPATGDPPIGEINVRLGVEGVSQDSFGKMPFVVGETETIGSSLVEVVCQGRSRCPFAFAIGVGKPIDAGRKIRVEWVLDVEVSVADGAEFDPAAKIVLEVRPDP